MTTQQSIAKNIKPEDAYRLLATICDTMQISPPAEINQAHWIIRMESAVRYARRDSVLVDKFRGLVDAWEAR